MKKKTFNWITFLKSAIRKEPTKAAYEKAYKRSGNWPTCACGQLCKSIPRQGDGEPKDKTLGNLGYKFYTNVGSRHWIGALDTFLRIEARTKQLLKKK